MKCLRHSSAIAVFAFILSHAVAQAAPNWQLVWADEFSGPQINRANWTYDTGAGGWGNNELQYYTERPQNSYVTTDGSGNGMLVIEAKPEKYRNASYTSARMKTQGLQNWTYGRIEARMSIPGGKGVWPAFWMLGADFPSVGWPKCGEIDIMEHVEAYDMGPTSVRGSLHGPVRYGANSIHGDATVQNLTGNFHVFAVEWEPAQVRWYVDGQQYLAANSTDVPGNWVFNHPFFIIMNVAIGGSWPGSPDSTTPFPARMVVDYVRVYRDANQPVPGNALYASVNMSTTTQGPNWQAVATVTITDGSGRPVPGATVTGAWSGLINVGVTQKTTDAAGIAVLTSGRVRSSGTIKFTVVNVNKAGYIYVPSTGGDSGQVTR